MTDFSKDLITNQTAQKLNQFFSGLLREQATLLDQIKEEILSNITQYARMPDFRAPVQKVEAIFLKKAAHLSQDKQAILKRALVAKLALNLPAIVENMNLPASILALYPDAFERVADYLKSASDDAYDLTSDFFRKDIRFVLGLTVPCGTFVVDMFSRVRLRSVLISFLRSGDISTIIRYLRMRGYGPWLHMHIDQRYLTDLNEQAHDKMYLRIADLLKRRKDIRGTTGSSWLYDPQLLKIGTRHAYIQLRPVEGGAFLLRHGKGNAEQATMTSKSRRRLYEEGKYIPREYSMLWPRKELIAWAEQNK
jgi:hypothetical protein